MQGVTRSGLNSSPAVFCTFSIHNWIVSLETGLVESSLDYSIKELRDQIIEIARSGRAVKIEGLGTWSPNIGMDGSFDLQYRADTALIIGLNEPGTFTGTIRNRENIGRTGEELVMKWNAEHPQDQVAE